MSQQIYGPARYQKTEESGMPHAQPTAQAMTALIRNAASVDTQKTKSLCCVAAGITALARRTTEGRIPHAKLRGAAPIDATLLAQKRLFAQLALEEKTFSVCGQHHRSQLASRDGNNLRVVREDSGASHHIFLCAIREQTCEDNAFLQSAPNFQEGLDHFREWQIHWINPLQSHQLCLHSGDNFGFESYITGLNIFETPKEETADFCRAPCHTANKLKNHLMPLATRSHSIPGLLIANVKGCTYSRYSSERLEPCSSILLSAKRIKQDKQRPAKPSYRHKTPNYPNAGDPHLRRHAETFHALWLPAIQKKRACPFPDVASMKEVA
ncbi:hypothetical protein [Pseudomonas protegens]|uniref:hypothetical protein n=1 Tax=Pseudomonas protegens TaxID=380021 RepID=UPI000B0F3128|nr:hypothetical protein [Pseudomonas protegens]